MDGLDYILAFSSEIALLGFAFLIAGFNFYYFSIGKTGEDKSLAGVFLSYHHKEGDKVYGKLASITTVVNKSNTPFIAEAYAETTPFLETTDYDSITEADNLTISDNSTMVRPNPDSVAELIAKQVKVHTVESGETLSSIAKASGIKSETIMWANKLPNSTVKPGWQLLILPTNGVLVKADSNTTLPDISTKYNCSLETIIAYNGLDGADDIEEGRIIIAPGCKVPEPKPVAKPTPKKSTTAKITESLGTILGKHIFPKGYCTWYVATKMEIDFGGNANQWPKNAAKAGYPVIDTPVAGSAVVTTDGPRRYGHVAYVERVTDSHIYISEMNYKGLNIKSTRAIPRTSKAIVSYILPKQ